MPTCDLRVLMTADTVGGIFPYALTLATELSRRGAVVHLATFGPALRDSQRAEASAIPSLTLHESTYALEWMQNPWQDVSRAADWLLAIEREVAADIVHLNGYCQGSTGFRAPVVITAHSCVLSWWQSVHGRPAPAVLDRYRIEVSRGLSGAGAVIAPTAAMMRALRSHYGPIDVQVIVPQGAYPPRRGPKVSKQRAVLAAGSLWDRAKNLAALGRVAVGFAGPVRVVGPTQARDGSVSTYQNVEMLGLLDGAGLARQMAAAAIFALPARYEPFGVSAVEAALRRCALVLGNIESQREVWGDAAFYVDPDDDRSLADALDAFACDEEMRRDYAARAVARASWFTPTRMADATIAVYARLLHDRAGTIPWSEPVRVPGTLRPCAKA